MAVFILFALFTSAGYPVLSTDEMLKNPSFEGINGEQPSDWTFDAYNKKDGITVYGIDHTNAHSGDQCIFIESRYENDARFNQLVHVKENKLYKLSGWIRTENVGTDGKGANLSIEGKLTTTKDIKGTNNEWQNVEMYIAAGNAVDSIIITIGIGGYSRMNIGKAWFDDISIVEVDSIPEGAILENVSAEINPPAKEKPSPKTDIPNPEKSYRIFTGTMAAIILASILYYFLSRVIFRKQKEKYDDLHEVQSGDTSMSEDLKPESEPVSDDLQLKAELWLEETDLYGVHVKMDKSGKDDDLI